MIIDILIVIVIAALACGGDIVQFVIEKKANSSSLKTLNQKP